MSKSSEQGKKFGFFARKGTDILRFMLPRKGKRAVFLTTLFMEIAKISPAHEQTLRELNDYLKIVNNFDSIRLPASLHDQIWSDREFYIRVGEGTVSEEEIEGIAKRAINQVPEWSQYGDYDQVLEDTKNVIRAYLKERARAEETKSLLAPN